MHRKRSSEFEFLSDNDFMSKLQISPSLIDLLWNTKFSEFNMNQDLDLECKLTNMGEDKRRELKMQIDEHFQTIH